MQKDKIIAPDELTLSGPTTINNANLQALISNLSTPLQLFTVNAVTSPSTSMLEFYSAGGANLSNTNLNWATSAATIAPVWDTAGAGGSSYYNNFYSD